MKKFAKMLCAVLCAATAAGALAACTDPKQPPPDGGDKPPVTPLPDGFQGVTEEMPTEGLKVNALSNMKEASSVWQTKYEADAFRVTVWVKDEIVVANEDWSKSDGVKIRLSEVSEVSGYVAGRTVSLFAAPDGAMKFQKAKDAQTLADCADEISVSVKEWAESGETVVGYKVDAAFPYAALGVSAAEAKGNVSIAAELSNTSSASFTAAVRGAGLTEYGVDPENQNTYLVVEDDNEFALNSDPYPTGTFHYKKNVYDRTESYWDVSEDYLASSPRYGDRRAELKGSLGTGKWNELWFYREKSTLFYAESSFSLPENPVYFGENIPSSALRCTTKIETACSSIWTRCPT